MYIRDRRRDLNMELRMECRSVKSTQPVNEYTQRPVRRKQIPWIRRRPVREWKLNYTGIIPALAISLGVSQGPRGVNG